MLFRSLQAVDAARVYEPVHFVAHLDGQHLWPPDMREQWLAHSLETWGMVMERADGVPLFLENVFEPTPAQHVQVLRALGGRAGACLDIGHWHAFADGARKADLADWLSALGAFPMHLHLHDNDGSADQHPTGRSFSALPESIFKIDGMRYVVTSNGANIIDLKNDEVIYKNCIDTAQIPKILDFLKKKPYSAEIGRASCRERV